MRISAKDGDDTKKVSIFAKLFEICPGSSTEE